MSQNVIITKERYKELLKTEARMIRLNAGGVDNWKWYGASLHDADEPINDAEERIDKEVDALP